MRAGWLLIALTLLLAAPAQAVTRGWAPAGAMSTQRGLHGAATLDDGRVLVAGGQIDVPRHATNSTDLYDPATGAWSAGPPMRTARAGFALIKLPDGKVLAAGGSENGTALRVSELYDPATNAWTSTSELRDARINPAVVLLADGRALITGGGTNTAEVFNPAGRFWQDAGTFGDVHSVHGTTLLPSGAVLLAGGADGGGAPQRTTATLAGLTWTAAGQLGIARYGMALNTLPDGRALATGGYLNDTVGSLGSTELYDPTLRTWSPGPAMAGAHDRHSATTLPNGRVLVVGGFDSTANGGDRATGSAELYDPVSNSFSSAGSMSTPRAHPGTVLLRDGRVLVTGGYVNGTIQTATTEIWTPTTALTTSPSVTFPNPGAGSISITNTGDSTLLTDSYGLAGADPTDFAVDGNACRTIAAGATCVLGVRFAPQAAGARSATLTFLANTAAGTYAVPLSGTSTADTDGDGVPDGTDRCRALKGSTARQGCPTGLLADPSIRYRPSGKGIRVLAYYVKATSKARVSVKCSRKACKTTVTKGKGAKRVRITRLNNKRLKNGTTITITVSLKGRLTTTVTDRISKARRIEGRPRCAPVGC